MELEFAALDLSGENYFLWAFEAKLNLVADNLGKTIEDGHTTSLQDSAKAMIFLIRHLHHDFKIECLMVKDPLELWKLLKERYEHMKQVSLSRARHEWNRLRFQDFNSVSEYNSALFRIKAELNLCGETIDDNDMLEKTFSTFHVSNMLLQQRYRLHGFKKYHQLIPFLFLAEQNNELVMKDHEPRPSSNSVPFPEVNVKSYKHKRPRESFNEVNESSYSYKRGRGRGSGQGLGHGPNNI